MQGKKPLVSLAAGALLCSALAAAAPEVQAGGGAGAASAAPAAPTAGRILGLSVQVSKVGGGPVGTFQVKPPQPIPTRPGTTYHLVLLGTTIASGKTMLVPVNATFKVAAGAGRISLVNPGSNSIDVKVVKTGPSGNQLAYTVGPGYDMKKGLAAGRLTLR
jgi:hypothetical protein